MNNLARRGFTLVEIMVVVAVLGVLVSITVVSYGGWRKSVVEDQMQTDLRNVATAMDSAKVWQNGYPTSLPSSFTPTSGITLTYKSGDQQSYCIEGTAAAYPAVRYYLNSSGNNKDPKVGTC